MLGPGCEEAALAALKAWPGMLFLDVVDWRRVAGSRWNQ
jgi:hypothetical protein